MKTIIVTGVNGFVGQHVYKELVENNIKVIAVGGLHQHKHIKRTFQYKSIELTKSNEVSKIKFDNVDGIIHLAGLANVGISFNRPTEYIKTNCEIVINLYEEILKQKASPRVLLISSASIYNPNSSLPFDEKTSLKPNSPYAVSKISQENFAEYYSSRGIETIIARPFNHIGPGQSPGYIIPDIINQINNVEKNKTGIIKVGNLKTKRDYTDVRDIARAYRLLIEHGKPGEIYNICSGKAISGHQILDKILANVDKKFVVKQDKTKLRPSDSSLIYGSYKKVNIDTNWKPLISLNKTIKDILTSPSNI